MLYLLLVKTNISMIPYIYIHNYLDLQIKLLFLSVCHYDMISKQAYVRISIRLFARTFSSILIKINKSYEAVMIFI